LAVRDDVSLAAIVLLWKLDRSTASYFEQIVDTRVTRQTNGRTDGRTERRTECNSLCGP